MLKQAKIKAVEEGITLKELFIKALSRELGEGGPCLPGLNPGKSCAGTAAQAGLQAEETGLSKATPAPTCSAASQPTIPHRIDSVLPENQKSGLYSVVRFYFFWGDFRGHRSLFVLVRNPKSTDDPVVFGSAIPQSQKQRYPTELSL